jgi:exodeoxyribonuclease VII small subunit
MTKSQSDVKNLSFEQALAELEAVVRRLEGGGDGLDGSIADYTRGVTLKQHCEAKLKEAQQKIEKIVKNADGTLSSEPFGIPEK